MPNAKRKIVVIDDHPLFRDGLSQLINRQEELACAGCVGTSGEAADIIERDKAELLILDLGLHGENGMHVLKALKGRFPTLLVLVLSHLNAELPGERALRAGANGYVMKEQTSDEVLHAIRTIFSGDVYKSPRSPREHNDRGSAQA